MAPSNKRKRRLKSSKLEEQHATVVGYGPLFDSGGTSVCASSRQSQGSVVAVAASRVSPQPDYMGEVESWPRARTPTRVKVPTAAPVRSALSPQQVADRRFDEVGRS